MPIFTTIKMTWQMVRIKNAAKEKIKVPEQSIRRLSVYLRYLYNATNNLMQHVSAPQMGKEMNFDPTQIVKDISLTGMKGKPRSGYDTMELIRHIENYLNYNKTNHALLAGTGKLGSALISYPGLESFGLKIVAGFDTDPEKAGIIIQNIPIYPMEDLPVLAKRLGVEIGIITTPANVAQDTAKVMTNAGISAIWNFAPINLRVPDHVIVQNTSMYSNVAIMLKKLQVLKKIG
jgi:redox-sensing transcriptional repressor